MWSKKLFLKRDISCDAHLLNELLETDVEFYIDYLRMNEQTNRYRNLVNNTTNISNDVY